MSTPAAPRLANAPHNRAVIPLRARLAGLVTHNHDGRHDREINYLRAEIATLGLEDKVREVLATSGLDASQRHRITALLLAPSGGAR